MPASVARFNGRSKLWNVCHRPFCSAPTASRLKERDPDRRYCARHLPSHVKATLRPRPIDHLWIIKLEGLYLKAFLRRSLDWRPQRFHAMRLATEYMARAWIAEVRRSAPTAKLFRLYPRRVRRKLDARVKFTREQRGPFQDRTRMEIALDTAVRKGDIRHWEYVDSADAVTFWGVDEARVKTVARTLEWYTEKRRDRRLEGEPT